MNNNIEIDIVNVRDFGAIGNGIADDTAAINNAIAFARRPVIDSTATVIDDDVKALPVPAQEKEQPS